MNQASTSFEPISSLSYTINAEATADQLVEELQCLTSVLNEHLEDKGEEDSSRTASDWLALYASRQIVALVQALRTRVPEVIPQATAPH